MTDPYTPPVEIVPCCEHVRTKMQHCSLEDMRAGRGSVRVSTTATYWCNRTMTSFGPDDQPSVPESCQPGRTCYRPNA